MRGVTVALLLLVVLAVPAFAQVSDDQLIVPGQRIGKWTLDMTIKDLLKMNGPRSGIGSRGGCEGRCRWLYDWDWYLDLASKDFWEHDWDTLHALTLGRNSQKVMALVVERGHAEKIHYKTAKGVGPLSSQKDLYDAYGRSEPTYRPTAVTMAVRRYELFTVIYDRIGLAAWVWGPGEVRNIPGTIVMMIVFRPGTARSIWKF